MADSKMEPNFLNQFTLIFLFQNLVFEFLGVKKVNFWCRKAKFLGKKIFGVKKIDVKNIPKNYPISIFVVQNWVGPKKENLRTLHFSTFTKNV